MPPPIATSKDPGSIINSSSRLRSIIGRRRRRPTIDENEERHSNLSTRRVGLKAANSLRGRPKAMGGRLSSLISSGPGVRTSEHDDDNKAQRQLPSRARGTAIAPRDTVLRIQERDENEVSDEFTWPPQLERGPLFAPQSQQQPGAVRVSTVEGSGTLMVRTPINSLYDDCEDVSTAVPADSEGGMAPETDSFMRRSDSNLARATIVDDENEFVLSAELVTQSRSQMNTGDPVHPKLKWFEGRRGLCFVMCLAFWLLLITVVIVVFFLLRSDAGNTNIDGGDSSEILIPTTTTMTPSGSPSFEPIFIQIPSGLPSASMTPSRSPVSSFEAEVIDIIESIALRNGDEFRDPDSYQSRALDWVIQNPLTEEGIERSIQRYALACILMATNSTSNFLTNSLYESDRVPPWNNFGDDNSIFGAFRWLGPQGECGWFGLQCKNPAEPWAITSIELDVMMLTGSFPPETQLLRFLKRLDLFDNPFLYNPGSAGNDWLGNLTSITFLAYGNTGFQYDEGIPPAIGRLSALELYDFSSTLYTGQIQDGIFPRLTNLLEIGMRDMTLASSIPHDIQQATALERLFAHSSSIRGDLLFMEGMESLQKVELYDIEGLGGPIPSFMGSLSKLLEIRLSACSFSGTLPTELGLLSNIVHIELFDNQLSGSLPSELGKLTRLSALELHSNPAMNGPIPESICLLTNLNVLSTDCPPIGQFNCTCCTRCGP